MNESALTKDEIKVLDRLAEAWNAYLLLDATHPDDVDEFRHTIHEAQRHIMARSGARALLSLGLSSDVISTVNDNDKNTNMLPSRLLGVDGLKGLLRWLEGVAAGVFKKP